MPSAAGLSHDAIFRRESTQPVEERDEVTLPEGLLECAQELAHAPEVERRAPFEVCAPCFRRLKRVAHTTQEVRELLGCARRDRRIATQRS